MTAGKSELIPQTLWETGELSPAEAFALEGRLMGRLGGPLSVNPNTFLLNEVKSFSSDSSMFPEIRKALSGPEGRELWEETMRRLKQGN